MQDIPDRTPDEYRKSKQAYLDAMIARHPGPAQTQRELHRLDRWFPDQQKRSQGWHLCKPVVLLDPNGKELGRWKSAAEAAKKTQYGVSAIKNQISRNAKLRDGNRFAHLATVPDARAA